MCVCMVVVGGGVRCRYTWSSDEVELDSRGLVPKEDRGRVYGTEVGLRAVGDVVEDRVIGTPDTIPHYPAPHRTTLPCTAPHYTIPHYNTLHYTTLRHTAP